MPRTAEQNRRLRAESRERILRAAMTCFATRGFHGTTMEEIARTAGTSVGLPYRYFDGKGALLAEMMRRRMETLREIVDGATSDGVPPGEALETLIDGLLGNVIEDPDGFSLLLSIQMQPAMVDGLSGIHDLDEELTRHRAVYEGSIRELFEALDVEDPEAEALYFRATLLGLSIRLARAPDSLSVPFIGRRLARDFLPES